jgi:capsular polysaccharide export protein
VSAAEIERQNRTGGIGAFVGIARWKRKRIRQFFTGSPDAPFCNSVAAAVAHIEKTASSPAIAIWPSRTDAAMLATIPPHIEIYRIEDGFIRSAGLGAHLVQPCSIAFDKSGIYYDPRSPSDLETILSTREFDDEILTRASKLIARICAARITKYNLVRPLPDLPTDRKIIVVAGQVMDDQSVLLGSADSSSAGMLAQARARHPDGFVVYKPHPDVMAGLRRGDQDKAEIAIHADAVVGDVDTLALLDAAHEVHVITSLIGFEGLLRGCKIVTYGSPFYAGWGLTEDRHLDEAVRQRRTRQLTLPQLGAGALIEYPLYADPISGAQCTPEELVTALAEHKLPQPSYLQRKAVQAVAVISAKVRRG